MVAPVSEIIRKENYEPEDGGYHEPIKKAHGHASG
jgi:hypothetical protein